jgi:hypothetical protein
VREAIGNEGDVMGERSDVIDAGHGEERRETKRNVDGEKGFALIFSQPTHCVPPRSRANTIRQLASSIVNQII